VGNGYETLKMNRLLATSKAIGLIYFCYGTGTTEAKICI